MKQKDFDLIARELFQRLKLVKSRYEKINNRHAAILEIENLIHQFADSLNASYENFDYSRFYCSSE